MAEILEEIERRLEAGGLTSPVQSISQELGRIIIFFTDGVHMTLTPEMIAPYLDAQDLDGLVAFIEEQYKGMALEFDEEI